MNLKRSAPEKKQVASQQQIKEANLNLVFNLINKHEPVSRAELAHITRLSPTTISSLTDQLLQGGMILETGAGTAATSGRKPIMLEINPGGGFVASVEFLEDAFRCFLYDLQYKAIGGGKYAVSDYSSIGGQIISRIDELLDSNSVDKDRLLGISVGIPALIDYSTSKVISSTVVPIDPGNDFYNEIKKYYGIPVLVENESCLCAFAEKESDSSRDVRSLIFVDINVGIGAGIVLNGRIFTGSFGTAGEIGHMSIDMNGPKCKCGNRGCLEVMAGIPAILQKTVFAIMSGRETVIKSLVNNDYNRINMDVIVAALEAGDGLVSEIIDETAERLAFGVNNIINLFSPEVVVIGGELTKLGEGFLDKLKNYVRPIGLLPGINKVKVTYSHLKEDAVTLGGAKCLLSSLFKA